MLPIIDAALAGFPRSLGVVAEQGDWIVAAAICSGLQRQGDAARRGRWRIAEAQ